MKKSALSWLLFLLPLGLFGQTNTDGPRLAGIVNLPPRPLALLELPGQHAQPSELMVLTERQSESSLAVEKILPEQLEVKVSWHGVPTTLRLPGLTNQAPGTAAGLVLDRAAFNSVLSLYSQYAQRTLLRWPDLTSSPISLRAFVTNQVEAASVLQQALANQHIVSIEDGAKFLMVIPEDRVSAVKPRAPAASTAERVPSSEIVAAGNIDFRGADVRQVIQIYAVFLGSRDDHEPLPLGTGSAPIYFTNQSPLTRRECFYAFDTLLSWQNLKVLRTADGALRVVRATHE